MRLAVKACMWLSPAVWNLVVTVANRAQISLASTWLPPWPQQYTCRARCSRVAARSTAAGSRVSRVPVMASVLTAAA